ncbi:MAG: hypothetical protein ACKOX6_10305 [Bdellovibrio sp.]
MEDVALDSLNNSLSLNFDMSSIIAGLIFGLVGWYVLKHGRREANMRNVGFGLALMIYPYFVDGPKLTWAIGLALCGFAYFYW